jgi:hypothetical protein
MQVFPRALNLLPLLVAMPLAGGGAAATFGLWYYASPKNLQVGYAPEQPIPYSHKLHVDELGIDCRYCHANVERSQEAMIPPTQTCRGCHAIIPAKLDSPKLAPLRASWASGDPVAWLRVHKLPDHVFFDHSVHLAAGVGCVTCHGRIDQMEVVRLDKPISMGWCLECHRDHVPHLRPRSEITNMTWQPSEGDATALAQADLHPPEHCSGCHR